MVRCFAVVVALSCLASTVWAQAQPAPRATATPAATAAIKPAVKKPAPKAKITAKPPGPAETGPCQLGVVPALGDTFVVQKVGLTIFGNEQTEVPVDGWGFDDLVVARVRAAAPGATVRRIAHAREAFAPYDHPAPALFRNSRDELTAIVRQITANAGCERYLVVTRLAGQLDGTNQILRGIGVLNHGTSILSHTSLFANVEVTVFDGQSLAIQKIPFGLGSLAAGFTGFTRDPLTVLDNSDFPEPAAAAAGSAMLRDRARALLAARLDKALSAHLKEE
jgi:hypothetical protein